MSDEFEASFAAAEAEQVPLTIAELNAGKGKTMTTGTSARDELAGIIDDRWHGYGYNPRGAADAILAAGYRKPRTVTTVEELEGLPDCTVVRDSLGVIRERFDDPDTGAALWIRTGASGWLLSRNFKERNFPVTVLHEGEA